MEVLRNMADCVRGSGDTDANDIRLALYAAYYTWRNAVAGEDAYAMEVNDHLGVILGSLDTARTKETMAFLIRGSAEKARQGQTEHAGLYVLHAIAFMPGLAHGSDLKAQAQAWLDRNAAGSDLEEEEIAESVSLLRNLLGVKERS
jgi:hypothetical protein